MKVKKTLFPFNFLFKIYLFLMILANKNEKNQSELNKNSVILSIGLSLKKFCLHFLLLYYFLNKGDNNLESNELKTLSKKNNEAELIDNNQITLFMDEGLNKKNFI
jgi:hypothetical protein